MQVDLEDFLYQMKNTGMYHVSQKIDTSELINQCYSIIKKHHGSKYIRHWEQPEAGDQRVFFDPKLISGSEEVWRVLDHACSLYMGEASQVAVNMYNRVEVATGNIGSGGGWHRDSFKKQIKVFIYLNDVSEDNGPLAYVQRSHTNFDKIRYYVNGDQSKRSRFSKQSDRVIFERNATKFIGKAGSILVADTSGRHAGLPVLRGTRIALTQYRFPVSQVSAMQKRFLHQ